MTHNSIILNKKDTYIGRRMEDDDDAANKHTKHHTAFFSGSLGIT